MTFLTVTQSDLARALQGVMLSAVWHGPRILGAGQVPAALYK